MFIPGFFFTGQSPSKWAESISSHAVWILQGYTIFKTFIIDKKKKKLFWSEVSKYILKNEDRLNKKSQNKFFFKKNEDQLKKIHMKWK